MTHPDPGLLMSAVILVIVFAAGTIIPISIVRIQNRTKMKAIEVLKTYADRGEEPPASVLDAINRVNWSPPAGGPSWARRPTRADHLAHVAGGLVCTLGSAAVVWWQAPAQQPGLPSGLMVTAVIATIFFAGSTAARLVGALTTRDGE